MTLWAPKRLNGDLTVARTGSMDGKESAHGWAQHSTEMGVDGVFIWRYQHSGLKSGWGRWRIEMDGTAGLVWHAWSLFLVDPPLAFSIASSALVLPRSNQSIWVSCLYHWEHSVYAILPLAWQLVVTWI